MSISIRDFMKRAPRVSSQVSQKQLILLQLNEINIDVVRNYIATGLKLPTFGRLINEGFITTTAEAKYEHLEPWIQWPSVYTGKTFGEHQVFRLGDMVSTDHQQIFELIESAGYKVGAISPMNAANRLKSPVYFIPDPWTVTCPDKSWLSRVLTAAIRQIVNDNSQGKVSLKSGLILVLSFIKFVRLKKFLFFGGYALSALKKPWRKALFLDLFLHEVHLSLVNAKKPNFSTLFLNAGAHIQHHYFLNSTEVEIPSGEKKPQWYLSPHEDPVREMLIIYDEILRDLIARDGEILIANGLSQEPFLQPEFYYRLKDHCAFLSMLGIPFSQVIPRMTRDFLVVFESVEDANFARDILTKLKTSEGQALFGEIEQRQKELFVVLTYSEEITTDTLAHLPDCDVSVLEHVVFVAIKNGAHVTKGFAYFSEGIKKYSPEEASHVASLSASIRSYFGIAEDTA